ncbi:MAG: hypothetical protein ACTSXC_02920 [Candidatus Freyarchaeota archaeon]
MVFEFVKRKAEEAYEALVQCVRDALDEDNLEYGVICAVPLVKMADVEKGSYLYEKGYFNVAMELGKEVVKRAREVGVPSWLERHVKEIEEVLKDWGYED